MIKIRHKFTGEIIKTIDRSDLVGADLVGADLGDANLGYANLGGANLGYANLVYANLVYANLGGANLVRANLGGANLVRANLGGANLGGANLVRANLGGANLVGANLVGTDLGYADLGGANLVGTDLGRTNLDQLTSDRLTITPEGELIGWKKCREGVIVKILIPKDARRSNATTRKCRSERSITLEVFGADFGISIHDENVLYKVGETTHCHAWDEDRWNGCSGGIHFFLTRSEAESYS